MGNALIICTGSTIKTYKKEIDNYIDKNNPIIIGVNNSDSLFALDYNMWTNYSRFKEFYKPNGAQLVLSRKLHNRLGKLIFTEKNNSIFSNAFVIDTNINKWRTTGERVIQWAHNETFDAFSNLHIVGMDGYTLNTNQHHYGTGLTDGQTRDESRKKDEIINKNLTRMKNEGILFDIITPTVHKKFYQKGILC